MSGSSLTGSRIRERRLALGVRQAALAKAAGISSSYLNLIEHNRRRIGGKLLLDLAAALDTEPALLSEGAEFALLTALGEAAERAPDDGPERARAEEFAGRFPGWAALVADQHARISGLEQQVSALSDRLTHDPFLSASLHEMLSSVTSIRSTASILAGDEEIEPQWQARFHGNLREDAVRLTDAAQRLVDYLDAPDTEAEPATTPQEELDAYLAARNFHLPELEAGEALDGQVGSPAAHALAERFADRYRAEAAAVPVAALEEALAAAQGDPLAAAQVLGQPFDVVLRRIGMRAGAGLVECDGSGTLTLRRAVEGFALPRFGAACPLWPLFTALTRPHVPLTQVVATAGAQRATFRVYAIAVPVIMPGSAMAFGADPVMRATMLILPAQDEAAASEVGMSCRVCPRDNCPARREPSILSDAL